MLNLEQWFSNADEYQSRQNDSEFNLNFLWIRNKGIAFSLFLPLHYTRRFFQKGIFLGSEVQLNALLCDADFHLASLCYAVSGHRLNDELRWSLGRPAP